MTMSAGPAGGARGAAVTSIVGCGARGQHAARSGAARHGQPQASLGQFLRGNDRFQGPVQFIRIGEVQTQQMSAFLEPGEMPRCMPGRACRHAQRFKQPVTQQQAAIGGVDPRRFGRDQRAVQPDFGAWLHESDHKEALLFVNKK